MVILILANWHVFTDFILQGKRVYLYKISAGMCKLTIVQCVVTNQSLFGLNFAFSLDELIETLIMRCCVVQNIFFYVKTVHLYGVFMIRNVFIILHKTYFYVKNLHLHGVFMIRNVFKILHKTYFYLKNVHLYGVFMIWNIDKNVHKTYFYV